MQYNPHEYQKFCIDYLLERPAAGLFLKPGMGKTSVALTAAERLLYDTFEASKVLVIAPLRVAEDTWSRESAKWDHLQHLRVSRVLGSIKERRAALPGGRGYLLYKSGERGLAGEGIRDELALRCGHYRRAFQLSESERPAI